MEISDELIARYLTGEATPEEAMALDDWLKTPINQLYFEKLQRTWSVASPSKKSREIDVKKAWARMETRQMKTGLETKRSETKFLSMPKIAFGIAAAILIILTFGIVLYFDTIGKCRHPMSDGSVAVE